MTGKGVGQSSQLCQVSIGQAESQLPYNTQIMSSPSFHWTCSWTSVPASLFVDLPSSFSCPSSCPQADLMGRLTTQEDFAPGCTLPWALQSQLHLHRPSFLNMASLSSFQVFIQALPLPWNALYVFFGGGGGVSRSTWDLSSSTRFKPVPPALEVWRLKHCIAREPLLCSARHTLPFQSPSYAYFFSLADPHEKATACRKPSGSSQEGLLLGYPVMGPFAAP